MTASADRVAGFAALLRPGPDAQHARITLTWRPPEGWGDLDNADRLIGMAIQVKSTPDDPHALAGEVESARTVGGGQVEAVIVVPYPEGL